MLGPASPWLEYSRGHRESGLQPVVWSLFGTVKEPPVSNTVSDRKKHLSITTDKWSQNWSALGATLFEIPKQTEDTVEHNKTVCMISCYTSRTNPNQVHLLEDAPKPHA